MARTVDIDLTSGIPLINNTTQGHMFRHSRRPQDGDAVSSDPYGSMSEPSSRYDEKLSHSVGTNVSEFWEDPSAGGYSAQLALAKSDHFVGTNISKLYGKYRMAADRYNSIALKVQFDASHYSNHVSPLDATFKPEWDIVEILQLTPVDTGAPTHDDGFLRKVESICKSADTAEMHFDRVMVHMESLYEEHSKMLERISYEKFPAAIVDVINNFPNPKKGARSSLDCFSTAMIRLVSYKCVNYMFSNMSDDQTRSDEVFYKWVEGALYHQGKQLDMSATVMKDKYYVMDCAHAVAIDLFSLRPATHQSNGSSIEGFNKYLFIILNRDCLTHWG